MRLLRRTVVYRGRVIQLTRELVEIQGHRLVRETIRHPGSVVIVPVLDRSRLVFVKQYRHAVGRILLELPAGTRDRDEPTRACARRELEEETGWRAGRMTLISRFYPAPGVLGEEMTLFLATGLTRGTAHPEPDEFLEPVVLPLRTALSKIRSGEICDAKSIIGVLLIERLLAQRRRVGGKGFSVISALD